MFPKITAPATSAHTQMNYYHVESEILSEDYGTVHTYGIALRIFCANKSMNHAQTVLLYPDVAVDRDKVYRLVELMNELQLLPIHIEDVIEDFLFDYSVEL